MPTDAEQIKTIKSQVLALMVDLTENPKPTYTIDGQNVQWKEYMEMLEEKVEWCDKVLAGAEPFELHHQGYT